MKKKRTIHTVFQQLEAVSRDKTSPLEMRASLAASAINAFLNAAIDDLPEDIQSRVTHAVELYIKMLRNHRKPK